MELPITALLRPLVTEHRSRHPDALRALVGEVVLDRRAYDAGGGFGTKRKTLAVQLVLERVHLLFDDVGDFADRADEQRRRLDDRDAQVAITVLTEDVTDRVLEELPERRLVGKHVVHAADGLQGCRHTVTPVP